LLARSIRLDAPSAFDEGLRRELQQRLPHDARAVLSPLFALGLPGAYITAGYATALWLRRRRRAGGPAIVASAWLGWLVHRGLKLVYVRERPPRPGDPRRIDSYPSGHTTGVTALAVTSALVLRRQNFISRGTAIAVGVAAPLVMGAYRLIDDEHWTTDVIGGWMLGSAIALTCTAVLGEARGPRIRRARQTPAGRATTA
jgi:undecaprenyl-diphosphatase